MRAAKRFVTGSVLAKPQGLFALLIALLAGQAQAHDPGLSTATVRLNSGAAVTQTAGGAGAITALNLAVVANGNVDLCEVANTITGAFAASDTAAAAFVRFLDTAEGLVAHLTLGLEAESRLADARFSGGIAA